MKLRIRLIAGATALGAAFSLAACGGGGSVPSVTQPITPQSVTPSSVTPQSVTPQSSSLQSGSAPDTQAQPRFTVLRYEGPNAEFPATGGLASWSGSFTHSGTKYTYTMVGANPATSNAATTVAVEVIPLKVVIGSSTFDPSKKLPNGNTVIQNVTASPLFQSSVDYKQGGTNLGTTQYEDAFQRGNFWSSVKTHTGYHLMLNPTVAAEETLKPSKTQGHTGTEFGVKVGLVGINYIDAQLKNIIAKLAIPPSTFPLFLTTDVYETQGGCCIGGYHSFNGTNTYAIATYVDKAGAFSQDVSAFSHEIGEWIDDPFTNNNVACGILEVGDPLEGNPNYGGYPYTTNGFTYNLQDLVFLPYFGAPKTTSVNDWSTFQGETIGVCANGG